MVVRATRRLSPPNVPSHAASAPAVGPPGGVGRRGEAAADSALWARCLAGDEAAWDEFYQARTPELRRLVGCFLAANRRDAETIEEIVARVWYALVCDEARLFRRCFIEPCVCRCRFLAGIVRNEVRRYVRCESERARHGRQFALGCAGCGESPPSSLEFGSLLNEFASTLNPKELDFLENYLLGFPCSGDCLSDANVWQRRHRLRMKARQFLHPGDDPAAISEKSSANCQE